MGHQLNGSQLARRAFRIREVCAMTTMGKTRVYELINEGKLQSVKVGRTRLILASSLEALLASGQ